MANGSKQRILRAAIVYNDNIVEERLVRKREDVSVGQGPRNTFIVPEAKIPKSYTLFEVRGGEYFLVFEKRMEGRISMADDEIVDLKALSKSGTIQRKGNHFFLPLTDESRGKVLLGDVKVLFQFVDAPQLLPKPQLPAAARAGLAARIDWTFTYILLICAILLGGGGVGSDIWWQQTGQYLEVQYGQRRARIYEVLKAETLLQQEQKKKEEEDKKEEEEVPDVAEPTEEVEEVVEKKPQKKKRKGSTKRRTKTMKGDAAARAKKKTFLHVLGSDGKGGLLENTLKGGLASDKIAKAFEGMDGKAGVGFADGENRGPELAPEVKGGGTSSYKGLTGKDVGGKRIATKKVKTQNKDSGGERKVRLRVSTGSLSGQSGTGKIDKASVARVFRRRKGAIKYCYEKALKTNSRIKGKVGIRFKIGTAGRVTSITVTSNTTGDSSVGSCIKSKVKSWRFPPAEGGSVTFSHTFVLSSS